LVEVLANLYKRVPSPHRTRPLIPPVFLLA